MQLRDLYQDNEHSSGSSYDSLGRDQLLHVLYRVAAPHQGRYDDLLYDLLSVSFTSYIYSLFGVLLFLSFCDNKCTRFIGVHFHFLKTTAGKGLFDIFCSLLFLISGGVLNYIMCGCLSVCGVFFIMMGVF